jgi:hypothetical protein
LNLRSEEIQNFHCQKVERNLGLGLKVLKYLILLKWLYQNILCQNSYAKILVPKWDSANNQ